MERKKENTTGKENNSVPQLARADGRVEMRAWPTFTIIEVLLMGKEKRKRGSPSQVIANGDQGPLKRTTNDLFAKSLFYFYFFIFLFFYFFYFFYFLLFIFFYTSYPISLSGFLIYIFVHFSPFSSLLLASSVAWGEERFLFAGFAGSGPSHGGPRAISTCRLNWSALSLPRSCSLRTQLVCR